MLQSTNHMGFYYSEGKSHGVFRGDPKDGTAVSRQGLERLNNESAITLENDIKVDECITKKEPISDYSLKTRFHRNDGLHHLHVFDHPK